MICYMGTETDPAFNLAAEEYLLKNSPEPCFRVWRNRNAIIVGKNQNALAQINPQVVERHGIRVIRRISGGGAVYHDLGNVNYTFILATAGGCDIDYASHTRPIVYFLHRLGVPAALEGRSDLTVRGLKISGNAQHFHKQRMLHHGTLLFACNLELLAAALQPACPHYSDHAVSSIASRVTNIRTQLSVPQSVEGFMQALMDQVRREFDGEIRELSTADRSAIEALAQAKYRRWRWNFGASPPYRFRKTTPTPTGPIDLDMDVKDGIIQSLHVRAAGFDCAERAALEARLVGCRHERTALARRLAQFARDTYSQGLPVGQLLHAMT